MVLMDSKISWEFSVLWRGSEDSVLLPGSQVEGELGVAQSYKYGRQVNKRRYQTFLKIGTSALRRTVFP